MKSIYIAILLLSSAIAQAQKKYYVTILDSDNNPQARGIFLNALDAGVTIEVEKNPVFVITGNIHSIRFEKNTTKLEFMKLGAPVATETAATHLDHSKDSTGSENKGADKRYMLENDERLISIGIVTTIR